MVGDMLAHEKRPTELFWVRAHIGIPGNERAGRLAGTAAEKTKSSITSFAYLKLRISEEFRSAKDEWHADPKHHGTEEIPPPPPKKSRRDCTKNASRGRPPRSGQAAVYFKQIKKRGDDRCWFCHERKMTRSYALLHCTNARLRAARAEAWEGKDPGSIRVFLNNPRWERRLLHFLEVSGVGRLAGDEYVEETRAVRLDGRVAWETKERTAQ